MSKNNNNNHVKDPNNHSNQTTLEGTDEPQEYLRMIEMIGKISIDWKKLTTYILTADWLTRIRNECTNYLELIELYKPNWYYTELLKEQVNTAILGNLNKIGLKYQPK